LFGSLGGKDGRGYGENGEKPVIFIHTLKSKSLHSILMNKNDRVSHLPEITITKHYLEQKFLWDHENEIPKIHNENEPADEFVTFILKF